MIRKEVNVELIPRALSWVVRHIGTILRFVYPIILLYYKKPRDCS